jgi:aryl-alcohol dehydrogenase-like predicted oxidoreductase
MDRVRSAPRGHQKFYQLFAGAFGIDTIDLYQPCRLDNSVPVEDVIGTIADMIKEGKVRHLGVSEITADQLRKANSVYPVTALEIGYSLADRQIEDRPAAYRQRTGHWCGGLCKYCRRLAYRRDESPTAANDYHNHFSRFQGENLVKNLEKVELLKTMAKEKGYTPTQLAIAWVNAQGDHIMPLVSMSRRTRLPENIQAMNIEFTADEMNTLNTHFATGAILGGTYLQR